MATETDNESDCENISEVMAVMFISGSINVWTIIFAGFSIPRMSWRKYGMSGAVVHTPKLLKRSELIFFLLCLIHACCQIPDVLAHCYLHDAAWHIFKTTNSSTYLLHWVSMFAIFCSVPSILCPFSTFFLSHSIPSILNADWCLAMFRSEIKIDIPRESR